MIPQTFIDELLNRVDIVDVIEKFVPLKRSGANLSACCPFHEEKTPRLQLASKKSFIIVLDVVRMAQRSLF